VQIDDYILQWSLFNAFDDMLERESHDLEIGIVAKVLWIDGRRCVDVIAGDMDGSTREWILKSNDRRQVTSFILWSAIGSEEAFGKTGREREKDGEARPRSVRMTKQTFTKRNKRLTRNEDLPIES
jgi:hypothetical protein